ncbi:MAG: GntR family transcriptional regulator, partial [Gammaproteobacteria bacterium]
MNTRATSAGNVEPGAPSPTPTFAPLYRQIQALLTRSLQEGEWKPGEAIPSEPELATRFGVSQGTVRKAIDELAAAHVVVRRQGRGTFVASHHEVRTQFRFLRIRPDEPAPGEEGDGEDAERVPGELVGDLEEPAAFRLVEGDHTFAAGVGTAVGDDRFG